MTKTPNYDFKIQSLLSNLQPGERRCSVTGKKWKLEEDELDWCRKFSVPPSTVDPLTRMRMLFSHNTGLSLWWKPHAKTGEPILSYIHPDNPAKIVKDAEWFGLDHTATSQPLDLSTPFFKHLSLLYSQAAFSAWGEVCDSLLSVCVSHSRCIPISNLFG
jgi:hypothetical protein